MSRERILKDMDKNSKFFHAKAAVRSRRKLMLDVRSGRGIFRAPRMIKMKARNFYKNLYKQKPMPIIYFPQELVDKISEEEANFAVTLAGEEPFLPTWSISTLESLLCCSFFFLLFGI